MRLRLFITLVIVLFSSTIYVHAGDYEPGVLIVKTKPVKVKMSLASYKKKHAINQIIPLSFKTKSLPDKKFTENTYMYKVNSDQDIEKLAQEISRENWVEYAEPNYYVYAFVLPNDEYLSEQNYLIDTDLYKLLEIPVHDIVKVAVIDTGIDYTHPDIKDSLYQNTDETINSLDDDDNGFIDDVQGYNFNGYINGQDNTDTMDYYGHGTHIAGIISAKENNSLGIAGLNSAARILNIKFLDNNGRGTQLDGAAAIKYAVDMGAKVINCSWGYYKYSSVLKTAIDYAISRGVIVVAAAGNLGSNVVEYPAGFSGVLAVSSLDLNLSPSSFTSFGTHIDFAEYGRSIYSLIPNKDYSKKSGTSQSAAILTGIVSRVIANKPALTPEEVKAILIQSARDISGQGKDDYTGYGLIEMDKLVNLLGESNIHSGDYTNSIISINTASNTFIKEVLNFPNPFGTQGTKFGFTSSGGLVQIKVYNFKGTQVKSLEKVVVSGYDTISWDGMDDSGRLLANGTYFYLLTLSANGRKKITRGKLTILTN
ncbi:S8 family serine peptidase [Candidatus Margulisiibacteriota bacterium]